MDFIFYFLTEKVLYQTPIFIVCFFAFFACLIVFIYNLQNGIKGKWPAKHIVGTAVSASIMFICASFVCFYIFELLWYFFTRTPGIPADTSSSTISQNDTLLPLLVAFINPLL